MLHELQLAHGLPARGHMEVRPRRRSGTLCGDSRIVRRGAAVIAVAIAWGPSGAVPFAVGQPITTQDQREESKDPSVLGPQSAQPAPMEIPSNGESSAPAGLSADTLCNELGLTAVHNELPAQFFTRLIWQESRFDKSSVSRAGAQGIAQFMPATARERKLPNPFEPIQALHEAGRLLKELRTQFGNLGLAAAAYNAGPHRVRRWLSRLGHLPRETRAYVQTVTGRSVEEWAASRTSDNVAVPTGSDPCSKIAGLISERQAGLTVPLPPVRPLTPRSTVANAAPSPRLRDGEASAGAPADQPASMSMAPVLEQTEASAAKPADQPPSMSMAPVLGQTVSVSAAWGLQLIGDSSEVGALSAYRELQKRFPDILGERDPLVLRTPAKGPISWYRIRVVETNLQRAKELCARLQNAGGSCLVQRNE